MMHHSFRGEIYPKQCLFIQQVELKSLSHVPVVKSTSKIATILTKCIIMDDGTVEI